ncbi:MAG TPA: PP2C family serine/threonine-protein phosphatase [Polyangium sp.]|nr:PP2C family serine/threonine-protein phosphatase [Polyangium sp.]
MSRTHSGAVIVVADGAGGVGGAAIAAQFVCDFLMDRAAKATGDGVFWVRALRDADAALAADSHGGLTTAVVVEIRGTSLCGASVGDSGAWALNESGIVDLTAAQIRKPLIGSGEAKLVAFGPVLLRERLLVATDGIFKYAHRDVIAACALNAKLDDAAEALLEAVRLRNGFFQDDIALILCDHSP